MPIMNQPPPSTGFRTGATINQRPQLYSRAQLEAAAAAQQQQQHHQQQQAIQHQQQQQATAVRKARVRYHYIQPKSNGRSQF